MRHRRSALAVVAASALTVSLATAGALAAPPPTVSPSSAPTAVPPTSPAPTLGLIGTYAVDAEEGGAEVAALRDDRMYVINGTSLDIVDVGDPSQPLKLSSTDLSAYGASITSVAAGPLWVAATLPAADKTAPGKVVLLRRNGTVVRATATGPLPDMVTFDKTGVRLLIANEGEPTSYGLPDSVDPEGSITVVNAAFLAVGLPGRFTTSTIGFTAFNAGGSRAGELPDGVRIFGPGASVAQDLEPEYIALDPVNPFTAYVTLQENNAVAELDLVRNRVRSITALGTKDYSVEGNGIDASDRDDAINITTRPAVGMYQPDQIDSYRVKGKTYLVTANEGDAREWPGLIEAVRVGSGGYALDATAFPNAAELKANASLGRLNVSSVEGKNAAGTAYEQITSFGARSFSIWQPGVGQVWDSGDDLERVTAARFPGNFNSNNDENSFDTRSDDKGPEPEGIAVGEIGGRQLAFVGLERIGGLAVYDVTSPTAPAFSQYLNNRTFSGEEVGPDSGAEVVKYIPASSSPTDEPLVMVSNEISGTVSLFGAVDADGAGDLTLLHNNDGESALQPLTNVVGGASLPVGGVSAFKTVTEREIADARAAGNAVVDVYAGDSFLASATLACSLPPGDDPIFDAQAQAQIPYDAHIFGNHEFDYGPDFLERFIRTFDDGTAPHEPFLSANLDFSAEPAWADLIDEDGFVVVGQTQDGRVVGKSAIVTDLVTGQRFGIVGATTPELRNISSPRDVEITSTDVTTTAAVVQTEVDRLTALGLKKIIFVSHLQDVNNDRQLVPLLRDVDVAVAGGGDELLSSDPSKLLPGDPAPVGPYPILVTDTAGASVPIVTTSGNYKYVGRIDLRFDADGKVTEVLQESSYPRRVVPAGDLATSLGITDAVAQDTRLEEGVLADLQACLDEFDQAIARTESLLNVARGSATAPGVRTREVNGGNLVTDAFVSFYDSLAASGEVPERSATNPVVGVTNGGGIRQNAGDVLPVGGVVPGPITRLNTLNVLPFDNRMAVVDDVTPTELKEVFERSIAVGFSGAACTGGGGGQFLQVSQVRVVFDCSRQAQLLTGTSVSTPGDRVRQLAYDPGTPSDASDDIPIVVDGAVVAGAPNVKVVTNNFTAQGGDTFTTFIGRGGSTNYPTSYEQALVNYLLTFPEAESLPTIPASDVRYASTLGEGRQLFS